MSSMIRKHNLGNGWVLEPTPAESGRYYWDVLAPDGINSASLDFALEVGTTSCDHEIRIPRSVLAALDELVAAIIAADLY